ncbi:MAG: hypothetical protein WDN75_20870 [Bacteroidota bacterium]
MIYTFTNGTTINDAARWITLPIIGSSFQPSDFASLAHDHQPREHAFKEAAEY